MSHWPSRPEPKTPLRAIIHPSRSTSPDQECFCEPPRTRRHGEHPTSTSSRVARAQLSGRLVSATRSGPFPAASAEGSNWSPTRSCFGKESVTTMLSARDNPQMGVHTPRDMCDRTGFPRNAALQTRVAGVPPETKSRAHCREEDHIEKNGQAAPTPNGTDGKNGQPRLP